MPRVVKKKKVRDTVELRVVLSERPPKSDTRQPFIATTFCGWGFGV